MDVTGDDERHPVTPTEPPEAAESARVDQDASRAETDGSEVVVAYRDADAQGDGEVGGHPYDEGVKGESD